MNNSLSPSHRYYVIVGCIATWFAVIFQLYLIILDRPTPVIITLVEFFSFFTILTNIIIAVTFTLMLSKESNMKRFLTRPQTLTAVAVYISVVGLVYNTVLRQLWQPKGLQRVVDELLHLLNPILFFVHWMVFVPKKSLQWKQTFAWLLFPLVYTIYVVIRGAATGLYPYPFMNADKLGYSAVFFNCLLVLAVFLFFSFLFVAIARFKSRNEVVK